MKKVTQAVLLAGGTSSRFYPYNGFGHKSLITLGGMLLIVRTLEALKKHGITNIIVVENDAGSVSARLSMEEKKHFNITFVTQKKALGMGNALLCAHEFLQNDYFVLNAYHFEAGEYIKQLTYAKQKESDIVLLVRNGEDNTEYGLITNTNGKIKITEKSKEKVTSGVRLIGVYLLTKTFCEMLKKISEHEYSFEDAINQYSDTETIVTVETAKETVSLKYPWSLLGVKDFLLKNLKRKISKHADVSKNSEVNGEVVIADGAVIKDGAVITGPAYIGRGAFIGNNVVIRNGVFIEEGVVIGANMEVKDAIIMKNTTTHSGFIGDSIIGENTKIAADFTTGNVRLDRGDIHTVVKGVKVNTKRKALGVLLGSKNSVGIKVGTMPGVIIGNNVIIGPGTTVMENVPDNVSFYTEFKKTITKEDV